MPTLFKTFTSGADLPDAALDAAARFLDDEPHVKFISQSTAIGGGLFYLTVAYTHYDSDLL